MAFKKFFRGDNELCKLRREEPLHAADALKFSDLLRDAMFEQFMRFDAGSLGTTFEVPFFLFQGADDVVTLTGPAVDYFAEVRAPHKELELIEHASHFCAFTNPAPFLAALRKHVLPLAVR